jgi:hypothetical protein
MAFTFTLLKQNVDGMERMAIYKLTADTTYSGAVQTPLGFIDAAILTPMSAAVISGALSVKKNTTAASAAANGAVFISGCVNGDDYYLVVYGRS